MPRKIILDCDPGHDDAVALVLAHGSPHIELVAVTTVAGNQTLAKVTRNARAVAAVVGLQGVPVAAGCDRPLVRPHQAAVRVHGKSGLGGVRLPEPTSDLAPVHAVQLIIDTVMSHDPGEITLIPVGPLTNIALAARLEPRIVDRIREVVLMGGGYHRGNVSAVAEFNIYTDPEAAHIVFQAGWPVTMVGLDLTHQALATPAVLERIRAVDTEPARFVVELLGFFGKAYHESAGFQAPPVHDPCAVAYAIDPQVITTQKVPITVELSGAHTAGMTVADFRLPAAPECPTQVAIDLDVDRFWALVIDALARIGDPVARGGGA